MRIKLGRKIIICINKTRTLVYLVNLIESLFIIYGIMKHGYLACVYDIMENK